MQIDKLNSDLISLAWAGIVSLEDNSMDLCFELRFYVFGIYWLSMEVLKQ